MGTWNTRGLRGSTLEDLINRTNDSYREKKLALIQKIPTPITPIQIDKSSRHITLAYFDQKSTVDYIGAVQGIPVCFDAKECSASTFPLQNIHAHQIRCDHFQIMHQHIPVSSDPPGMVNFIIGKALAPSGFHPVTLSTASGLQ